MAKIKRINLSKIEESLRTVQREFPRINQRLTDKRDPLTDQVIAYMLEGYRAIDEDLASGTNLLEMGQSQRMLELNEIVLCGCSNAKPDCDTAHFKANKKHFYQEVGGVGELIEWLEVHSHHDVWLRAAGLFTRILSRPQLYLEGNHRTGALLISYLLVSNGEPPFVLTVENAIQFFEPASLIKKRKKRGIDNYLRLPKLAKLFAAQLEQGANDKLLRKSA